METGLRFRAKRKRWLKSAIKMKRCYSGSHELVVTKLTIRTGKNLGSLQPVEAVAAHTPL
jgi:hypothetical protein